jgi:hypothetical protein
MAVLAKPIRISAPQQLLLCPLGLPDEQSSPVRIVAGQQRFELLVSVLSRPDDPKTGAVCPAYADLPQVVLVKTGKHSYRIVIPTDGCGHYQRPALDALNRARAG